jgi:hypothetical protein
MKSLQLDEKPSADEELSAHEEPPIDGAIRST